MKGCTLSNLSRELDSCQSGLAGTPFILQRYAVQLEVTLFTTYFIELGQLTSLVGSEVFCNSIRQLFSCFAKGVETFFIFQNFFVI